MKSWLGEVGDVEGGGREQDSSAALQSIARSPATPAASGLRTLADRDAAGSAARALP